MEFLTQLKNAFTHILGVGDIVPIGSHQIKLLQQLGEGGYAFVYRAEDSNGKAYALKRILCHDKEACKLAEKEVKLMKMFGKHRNIVSLAGACKKDVKNCTEYYILMELCSKGTLMDMITRQNGKKFPEKHICAIFKEICKAVRVLHSMHSPTNRHEPPVAHRDLKIENVLVAADGSLRLCDFGSATTRVQAYTTREEICREEEIIQKFSTAMYRAPEMADLYLKREVGPKVDVWALGCILYVLAFFVHPFQEGGNLQILSGNYGIPADHSYSEEFESLLRRLLTVNVKKRPDIEKVLKLVQEWQEALQSDGHRKKKEKKGKSKKTKLGSTANGNSEEYPAVAAGLHEHTNSSNTTADLLDDWDPFATSSGNGGASSSSSSSSSGGGGSGSGSSRNGSSNSNIVGTSGMGETNGRGSGSDDWASWEDTVFKSGQESAAGDGFSATQHSNSADLLWASAFANDHESSLASSDKQTVGGGGAADDFDWAKWPA